MRDREVLEQLWMAGVQAVQGDAAVGRALPNLRSAPTHIVAVGKAASAMAHPAVAAYPETPCLIVTKYDHATDAPDGARVIEAAHPVPDENSLKAGQALLDTIALCGPEAHVLMLVSGGASALAEALPDDWDLTRLANETQRLLASGADIHNMNARRKEISLIKNGKLFDAFKGAQVTTLAISDVEGDTLDVIGSGIGAVQQTAEFAFEAHIVASNAIAREAIVATTNLPLRGNEETLYADVENLAPRIAQQINEMAPGLLVLGGEPTVRLPENPGLGGRNMALGALLAREIQGVSGVTILVAGTDGTDGPTDAAGAIVTGDTWADSGAEALAKADIYPWLAGRDALFKTGPTGTNVMDVLLVLKTG